MLVANPGPAAGRHEVLAGQGLVDHFRRNPQLRQASPRDLDINHLGSTSENGDLADIFDQQQFAAQQVRIVFQVGVGVAIPVDGVIDAVDITKVVVDDGRRASRRQSVRGPIP